MFAPVDRARLVGDRAGALVAVCERGRISVVDLATGDAIAELATDERARAVEAGWIGEDLLVLTQQRDHALVQRFAPRRAALVEELALDVRVQLGAIVADSSALVVSEQGAGLVGGDPLAATELRLDEMPGAVATAGAGFLLASVATVEQWIVTPSVRRFRAMRCPPDLAFLGGTSHAVWAISREDPRLFEVARWSGGDAEWLALPEPIRWAVGDPFSPVVVCGGARDVYVLRWEPSLRADVLAATVDAAAIVAADPLLVLTSRGSEPLAMFDDDDTEPLDAPTGSAPRSPRSEWRDEVRYMAPFAPHVGATPGRWGVTSP